MFELLNSRVIRHRLTAYTAVACSCSVANGYDTGCLLMLRSSKSKSFFKLKIESNRNRIFPASRQTICPLKHCITYRRRRRASKDRPLTAAR